MSFERLATGTTLLGSCLVLIIAAYTQPPVPLAESSTLLLLLFALYGFTEFFPLKRNQFRISLSLSVDLLIFMKFGLLPLVVTSQVLIFFTRWLHERKLDLWKVIANCGMFLSITGGAAGVYYLCGGTHTGSMRSNLLPLIAYMCAQFLINHVLLYLFLRALSGIRLKAFLEDVKVDLISSLVAGNLGLLVIALYESEGLFGLLAIGFPTILCVYVFKLFNDVSRSSTLFRNLASLTSLFSRELEVEKMSGIVTSELTKWFDLVECVILTDSPDEDKVLLSCSSGISDITVANLQALVRRIAQPLDGPLVIKRLLDEREFAYSKFRTLLIAPFKLGQHTSGYLCLLSEKHSDFDATTLDAVSILANQLTVSYSNALRYEHVEKQSLYDELTQLPNHRFLERRLSEEIMRVQGVAPLSLLLIDLDHFKKINDQFGHLAGNTVLSTLARTFELCLRTNDFVSRYGGEEFLVVLPGASKDVAAAIAEKIRSSAESMRIAVSTMDNETIEVALTVSIGVATFPDDTKDGQHLVRYADRAMYYGAKRAGRNKVATYQRSSDEEE